MTRVGVALSLLALACGGCDGSTSGDRSPDRSAVRVEAPVNPAEVTVYGARGNSSYHVPGCQFLKHGITSMTLAEAQAKGLTPCPKCDPPR